MFDGVKYLKEMAAHNKAVQQNKFCVKECAGLAGIEPMMQEFQREANFIIVDNTVDGGLNSNGTSYANRRIFTCSIVMRHKFNDLNQRNEKLDICREIYRQFLSRFISDSVRCKYDNSLTYIKPNLIIYKEMDVYTMQGATGITFMLPVDEPVDLCYNDNEWVLRMYNWLDEKGKSQQKKLERRRAEYEQGWCNFMVDIWHDRLMQLHVKDTGALIQSVRGEVVNGTISTITHKFLMYGIYVAAGVGNGYRHGNSGKDDKNGLQFLKGPGKHRKPRDWFSRKYLYSIKRLNEKEGEMIGDAYNGMLVTALDQLFDKESTLRSL